MVANPLTAKWQPLEAELARTLKIICGKKARFFGSHGGLPGLPREAFHSDGLLAGEEHVLALEVECTQCHPSTNVSKYWFLLDRVPTITRLEVVHVFTPAYTSYPWRKELAAFIAERAAVKVPLTYLQRDYRTAESYAEVRDAVSELLTTRAVELGLSANRA